MAQITDFYSDNEIIAESHRNRTITGEDVRKTFGRPVFVYGTLLTDQPNYRRILKGHTAKVIPAKLYGHSISAGPGFPFMAKVASGTPVIGELVYLPEKEYIEMLTRLDWLEGAGSGFYARTRVRVVTEEGSKVAWAYTCSARYSASQHIRSGSWIQHIGGKR